MTEEKMKTGIFTMKRILAFTIAVITSMTVLAGGANPVINTQNASAESTAIKENKQKISSAKEKLSDLEKKQSELDDKISSTKDDINKEEENQKAIQEQIETVQETILTLEDSIADLETDIAGLEEDIAKSEIKIKNKKAEIEEGVVDFKQRLRAMYVAGNSSYSDILIGATDFYDMLMKIELVKRVADHDNTMIDGLVELKGEYEAQEAQLEANKTELETNKADLEEQKTYHQEQKDKLDDLYAQSQAVIDQLEADKEAYEQNKEQINKEHEEFEAQIQKLYQEQEAIKKKEEEERKKKEEEERKRREEEERKRQQQNNNNNNGNSQPSNGNGNTSNSGQSSTNNGDYNYTDKSQFTWPVPGYYHISYGVGWRWGAYHAGIDIWSPGIRGAKICAAAEGTVILVSNTCTHDYGKNGSCGCGGGYGNYCIIDHGNGYWTLYGHSQYMSVKQGQHVNKGDVLGIIGSTGYSTGDHLHFEVRLNGVAQNPSNYV